MQSVSLSIRGSYWDSQIYSGDLILFDTDGALHKVDWTAVIDELATKYVSFQTALRVAFSDSDLFYNSKVLKILNDPLIEDVIKDQLRQLAVLNVEAEDRIWTKFIRTSDAPFKFLTTDTEIYYNQIIAAGDEGLFSAPRAMAGTRDILSRTHKHHDGKILQVKASNQNTAVAAAGGSDGLFEFAVDRLNSELLEDKRRLSNIACSGCDWAFQSVFGWNDEMAFLASFKEEQDPRSKKKVRRFDKVLRQEQIFAGQDLILDKSSRIWGSHEKVFCVSNQELKVLNYLPASSKESKNAYTGSNSPNFSHRGFQALSFDASEIIATGTAPFGNVIELDDRLVVLRSDGGDETFEGTPVHWRVFPRSEHYSNQLHIIYDDHIKIVSFVHDYFVDQTTKLVGFARGSTSLRSKKMDSSIPNLFN